MTSTARVYLAVDLGASSGRVVAGSFDQRRLQLTEVYRFENGPTWVGPRMYWDVLHQWAEIQRGLRAAASQVSGQVQSIGVDTWGVDFGLLGRGGELLGNPRHYRDNRTRGMLEEAFAVVSREEIFRQTGLQFMELNTLYQLLAMRLEQSPLLENAESLLLIPDLFHWLLSGVQANEFSNATTTQFYNPTSGGWATELLDKLQIPTSMLGEIVAPGTSLGRLLPEVSEAVGLQDVEIVVPGTHDTASAVMAVPATGTASAQPDWCYISSGTWSLMGIETTRPIINDLCRSLNFTNEGGVGNTIRLLKNIAGLWLVQECRRSWRQAGREYDWDTMIAQAATAPPLRSLIDPDHADFVAPADMPTAICEFCRRSEQPIPESDGATIRTALESLALRYRMVLNWLCELSGGPIETIHIVGGGAQNELLCQMAADACNRRVIAGPVEATAIGNLMMQAVSCGDLGSIAEARQVVGESFSVKTYLPANSDPWDEAFSRFTALIN